ncbi:MAG: hypothetical protein ACI9WS_002025 [Paraglaciecola psychrophila]|jgi:hypothetical protein
MLAAMLDNLPAEPLNVVAQLQRPSNSRAVTAVDNRSWTIAVVFYWPKPANLNQWIANNG